MYCFLSLWKGEILVNTTLRSGGWIYFGRLFAPHSLSGAKMGNCVLQQFGVRDFKPLP